MRLIPFPLAFTTFAVLAGCGGEASESASLPPAPTPTVVRCSDAEQLRERAAGDRRLSVDEKSDHARIRLGDRASYLASLAIVADLQCKRPLAVANDALNPAFEAARKAEAANSIYEIAFWWREANFAAMTVISRIVQDLPPSAAL
jgi:hypothetical protein